MDFAVDNKKKARHTRVCCLCAGGSLAFSSGVSHAGKVRVVIWGGGGGGWLIYSAVIFATPEDLWRGYAVFGFSSRVLRGMGRAGKRHSCYQITELIPKILCSRKDFGLGDDDIFAAILADPNLDSDLREKENNPAPSQVCGEARCFFSFHYLLPFILAALVVVHLLSLHIDRSNNPLGISSSSDKIVYHPYFTYNDHLEFIFSVSVCRAGAR